MTNDEKNRACAELLGFRHENKHGGIWHHPTCACTAATPEDKCTCVDGCYWGEDGNPPDATGPAMTVLLLHSCKGVRLEVKFFDDESGSISIFPEQAYEPTARIGRSIEFSCDELPFGGAVRDAFLKSNGRL